MRISRAAAVACCLLLAACGGRTGSGGSALPGSPATLGHARTARAVTAAARFESASVADARRTASIDIGSSNTTTADPPVSRPDTTPCVVTLFSGLTFSNFSPKPYQFAPPAACPGPWAKVVLEADLSVTAGRQFDRTATIGLGGATIFFGTTAEPSRTVARSWHVERDLTDLSALFGSAQSGQISIGNLVNSTYTGVLGASAKLDFYPPDARYPAPRVADVVVPLADASGNPVSLETGSDQLAPAFTPPTNVEAAYLDVIAQSQSNDEFWYTCFPDALAQLLQNCGSGSFRETEVAVDGRPAGVAPIYPWIYTGGIDPYLWRPIPGVQTLNFVPYRVDLTPFAATLDDGASHRVALSVYQADHHFAVTGNLLLFLDADARKPLTGGIDADTLGAQPAVSVAQGGSFDANGNGSGTLDTTSQRMFDITGHVLTSHGIIRTEVQQTVGFRQHQDIVNSSTKFTQNITQDTTVSSQTSKSGNDGLATLTTSFDWPLSLKFAFNIASDGSATQATTVTQGYTARNDATLKNQPSFASTLSDTVTSTDTLNFAATGALTTTGAASSQTYKLRDSTGICYGLTVTSAGGVVTGSTPAGC